MEMQKTKENDLPAAENKEDRNAAMEEFEKIRGRLKKTAAILIVLGILFMLTFWWWGLSALIIGIELKRQYRKDATLFEEGMPLEAYRSDIVELIREAWVGMFLLIGVLAIPECGATSRRRLNAIRSVLNDIRFLKEKEVTPRFLQKFKCKDGKFCSSFIGAYLDWLEAEGKIVRLSLNGESCLFAPAYLENLMERIDSLSRAEIRVPRNTLIAEVKKIFDEPEEFVEALINIPETGIESYTFADGACYVHGIHRDRVQICTACGIAELTDPAAPGGNGPYFCSDYCRETEKICEELVQSLRKERFRKEGIDSASFGGALHGILSSVSYNKGNVAARSDTGHGVAAENANTYIDRMMGRSAEVVGGDNAKNGADRVVNGINIQSKYCQSARESVNAAFESTGEGRYRYIDAAGKSMQLEVPRDQYETALGEMRRKFHEGKLPPDIRSEADAEKLVRKGYLTYEQSKNICRFGTIESIAYDACTGVIVGATAGGISFVLTTALTYYQTRDLKRSLQSSVAAALQTGGKVFAVYLLTAQLQRTAFVKAFIHHSAMDINFGAHGKFVERIGRGLHKMSGAKSGSFTKNANVAVKGAVVTAAAAFAVTSAWEIGKLCCGRMSGMQCLKNIAVSGGGIASGTVGALICGALLSPIPGGVFLGGLLGGALGGMLGGSVVKAGMDKLIQDDAIAIMAIVSDEFKLIAASFCLNEEEIRQASEELDRLISGKKSFVEDVYAKQAYRRQYAARLLRPIFIRICIDRPILCNRDVDLAAIETAIRD